MLARSRRLSVLHIFNDRYPGLFDAALSVIPRHRRGTEGRVHRRSVAMP
jgi:hypothetical protein